MPERMSLKWQPASGIISSKIEEELVLLSTEAGFYYSLDPIGSRIWELLSEKPSSLEKLVDELIEEYDVGRETCIRDVKEFIEEMAAKKLIVPVEE